MEREARIAEAAEDYDCCTYKLSDDCTATRLLEQFDGGYDITLEDCTDPTRLYRASCDDSLIVGRSHGLCDIVIDRDDSVSGRHCELSVRNGCWYVRDLQSSNGTKVNNQKVFQELLLKTGDILQLGQSVLQVSI
jgi:pSer/pThr/pTyr-binding forkhead associated (FHA) protein